KAILQFDPVLETRYIPHTQTRIVSPYGEFDISYSINNLGLRDRDLAGKPDDEFRILVTGNSFVEGWGVNEADGFVRVAERMTAAHDGFGASKHARFINAGIAGYGAAQSYLHAQAIWDAVDPEIIILVLVGTMVHADYRFLKQARLDANGLA